MSTSSCNSWNIWTDYSAIRSQIIVSIMHVEHASSTFKPYLRSLVQKTSTSRGKSWNHISCLKLKWPKCFEWTYFYWLIECRCGTCKLHHCISVQVAQFDKIVQVSQVKIKWPQNWFRRQLIVPACGKLQVAEPTLHRGVLKILHVSIAPHQALCCQPPKFPISIWRLPYLWTCYEHIWELRLCAKPPKCCASPYI